MTPKRPLQLREAFTGLALTIAFCSTTALAQSGPVDLGRANQALQDTLSGCAVAYSYSADVWAREYLAQVSDRASGEVHSTLRKQARYALTFIYFAPKSPTPAESSAANAFAKLVATSPTGPQGTMCAQLLPSLLKQMESEQSRRGLSVVDIEKAVNLTVVKFLATASQS